MDRKKSPFARMNPLFTLLSSLCKFNICIHLVMIKILLDTSTPKDLPVHGSWKRRRHRQKLHWSLAACKPNRLHLLPPEFWIGRGNPLNAYLKVKIRLFVCKQRVLYSLSKEKGMGWVDAFICVQNWKYLTNENNGVSVWTSYPVD